LILVPFRSKGRRPTFLESFTKKGFIWTQANQAEINLVQSKIIYYISGDEVIFAFKNPGKLAVFELDCLNHLIINSVFRESGLSGMRLSSVLLSTIIIPKQSLSERAFIHFFFTSIKEII
jgi:hypothetical protein